MKNAKFLNFLIILVIYTSKTVKRVKIILLRPYHNFLCKILKRKLIK